MNTFCIPIKVDDEADLYERFLPSGMSFSGELQAYLEDYLEDRRIGEGILEWVQVSPTYRRKGLGRFVVCELLRRLRNEGASFATVSGRTQNKDRPLLLYLSCGFTDPVIWHVITK